MHALYRYLSCADISVIYWPRGAPWDVENTVRSKQAPSLTGNLCRQSYILELRADSASSSYTLRLKKFPPLSCLMFCQILTEFENEICYKTHTTVPTSP